MSSKSIFVAGGLAVLALAACGKKAEAPAAAPASNATAPTATDVAPAAASTAAIKVNEGAPIDGDVTLKAPPTAAAGASIDVSFTGPANTLDYVDIVPRGYTQTSGELAYVYVGDAAKGAKLRVLTKPGDYDVRYVLDLKDGGRKVKVVLPLTITAATATLTAPATAESAATLSIDWTGPAGDGDYVDVVPAGYTETSGEISYAYTRDGTPAKFKAPGPAGAYLVRYVLEGPGGRKVLATAPLTVTQPTATLTAPDTAGKGKTVIVEWTGPKRDGDYVDLVKKGYMPTSGELSYFYTNGTAANELKMPSEAGDYDIRYVMEAPKDRIVLTKRTITVR